MTSTDVSAIIKRIKTSELTNLILRKANLYNFKKWGWILLRTILIIGITYEVFYPMIWVLHYTFLDPRDIHDITVVYVPKHITLANFKPVFILMDYMRNFWGSVRLSLTTSALHVLSCTLVAYGFARFRFKGRNLLFAMVILTLIVPPQTIMIPTYLHFRFFDIFGIVKALTGSQGINLLDSFWPFVLQSATGMGIKNGLYILIMRQFFRGMPKEIEEAAMVDGAGVFKTFYSVMLPNAVPAITTVFLFSFVWQWNDTYFVSIFLQRVKVLPAALATLASTFSTMTGSNDPYYITILNNTGTLLVIAPVLILYIFAQKYFVESVERSGIVG